MTYTTDTDTSKASLRRARHLARRKTDQEKLRAKNLPSRRGVIWMMVITGIYLMFEVAFAARLLDVVGSTTDLHEIEQIETAGRFISGFALTLVVWSAVVFPRLRKARGGRGATTSRAATALGLSLVACCTFSYWAQEGILELISHGSSAEQKQAASTLTLISSSVQNQGAVLDDIDFDAVGRDAPETMTFMALLPALALSVDDLDTKTAAAIDALLERQAQRALGPPGAMFETAYFKITEKIVEGYNEVYRHAAFEHREAMSSLPDRQRKAYRDYLDELDPYRPDQIPESRHADVRYKVVRSGVPVPLRWKPTDRQGFMDAVEKKFRDEVDPPYHRALRRAFGRTLPDDLTPATFFSNPVIQDRWREEWPVPDEVSLTPDLSPEAFKSQVYDTWVRTIVDEKKPLYIADIAHFEPGGDHHEDGVEAIRVAYVPFVAFGFSILGALVHTFKTANFAAQGAIGTRTMWRYRATKGAKVGLAAAVIYAGVMMARDANPVTRSVLFEDLEAQAAQSVPVAGPVIAGAIRATIQLQAHVYPVAEAIRSTVLLGITYDFDETTDTPPFELIDQA